MYSIGDFKSINEPSKMVITQHSRKRFSERGISLNDVCESINSGEIIEQYPDDYPFPSCLILGITIHNQYIHVVVSMNENVIYLITAYLPNSDKWESDWKTRKERVK
ncbi:MAG: DUF4258 domain-containing protein [Lachnospiraceae bacterium]|nr:DUF4258 domain-containing protein [Lachnospiraceae bacterium]